MSAVSDSGETVKLNLTPMMDVFSILITFLLMSFSTDPVAHDVRQGLELPRSLTVVALDEIPTISVTKAEILINDRKVTDVIQGDVPASDMAQGAIQSVYNELIKLKEANDRIAATLGSEKKLGTLTMEMDKIHTFKLVKRIMLSAQQAEFLTFKLMVSKDIN